MLIDFGRAGWLGKARQQPDRFRAVVNKVRTDGPLATWESIRAKLEMPISIGYCNVGEVLDEGGSTEVRPGQRVVSNSPHAEVVSSPHGLAALVPDCVSDEAAAFVPLASIALEGIDLMQVKAGDRVVVIGLGLIGQLAVRLLRALGCEVLGVDPVDKRRSIAATSGANIVPAGVDTVDATLSWSKGQGVVGVLITASSSSNQIVSDAARSCSYRGRVVLVGVVGLHLNRADYYRNEVSFQVSCSYGRRDHTGPGSVQANFRKILALMKARRLPVDDLITHQYPFSNAALAYKSLSDGEAMGIILDYRGSPGQEATSNRDLLARQVVLRTQGGAGDEPRIALLGAGNFAVRTILPALQLHRVHLEAVVSNQGSAALYAAQKFGSAWAGTDETKLWSISDLEAVFITTRHNSHAGLAIMALAAGKAVWVEKPLAISAEDLGRVRDAVRRNTMGSEGLKPVLMVGFNRRFAPIAKTLCAALAGRSGPLEIRMTINAGRLDPTHWTLNCEVGGGRIVGEGCHFIDLARFIVGAPLAFAQCARRDVDGQDGGCFELLFSEGSHVTIDYCTNLPAHVPKEVIEVSGRGFSAEIYNWSRLRSRGLAQIRQGGFWSRAPRKGHLEALGAFLTAVRSGRPPIPVGEIFEVSAWAIQLQAMTEGQRIDVRDLARLIPVLDTVSS